MVGYTVYKVCKVVLGVQLYSTALRGSFVIRLLLCNSQCLWLSAWVKYVVQWWRNITSPGAVNIYNNRQKQYDDHLKNYFKRDFNNFLCVPLKPNHFLKKSSNCTSALRNWVWGGVSTPYWRRVWVWAGVLPLHREKCDLSVKMTLVYLMRV